MLRGFVLLSLALLLSVCQLSSMFSSSWFNPLSSSLHNSFPSSMSASFADGGTVNNTAVNMERTTVPSTNTTTAATAATSIGYGDDTIAGRNDNSDATAPLSPQEQTSDFEGATGSDQTIFVQNATNANNDTTTTTTTTTQNNDDHHHDAPQDTTHNGTFAEILQTPTEVVGNSNNVTTNTTIEDNTTFVVVDTTKHNAASCLLALHSKDWLENPRYGNIEKNVSHAIDFPLPGHLLDHLSELVGHQSICHKQSMFQNLEGKNLTQDDNEEQQQLLIRMWRIRLMYLSFYVHQHEHAMEEAQKRKLLLEEHNPAGGTNDCQNDYQKYNVGSFDYECQNAQYLVAEVRSSGIGSIVKRDLFNVFIAGVALNRTVILYNGLQREGFYSRTWQLSSCPRGDYQCTFRPVSPCAPLLEDIYNSTGVYHYEFQRFLDTGSATGGIAQENPWEGIRTIRYLDPYNKALRKGAILPKRLSQISHSMIDQLDKDDARVPLLRQAADTILSDTDIRNFIKFDHEYSDAIISFMMYFLRPREDKSILLEQYMMNDLPPDFDSSTALGLPYRGSDKCNQESECLSFPTYMRLLKSKWLEAGLEAKYGRNATANVLVTSEVPNIMELANKFSTDELYRDKLPFQVRWITNTNDVHQGNGNARRPNLKDGANADDVMMSILSSFKLQMNAAMTIGNCCSNFHQAIFHLLRGGCGLHVENSGQCLQYRTETIYQLCCDTRSKRSCPWYRLEKLRKEYKDENITVDRVEMKLWEE